MARFTIPIATVLGTAMKEVTFGATMAALVGAVSMGAARNLTTNFSAYL
jgi:hypothetical protein